MDGITFYGRYFNVITMNTQSQKVSMAEKIGYSLGDCSANLVFQMMMDLSDKVLYGHIRSGRCHCRYGDVGGAYHGCLCRSYSGVIE